jgi:tryptophan halogenase
MVVQTRSTSVVESIVIVGGGTAGWLAANHLAKQLPQTIRVSVIESPSIPTIGVGEGTVPLMRETLAYFGIRETDVIQQCEATFKQGIKFINWRQSQQDNIHSYYHPFDPIPIQSPDLTTYWLAHWQEKMHYVDAVGVQGKVCDLNLAPKTITTPEFTGLTAYAYHLDAHKFTELLKQQAINQHGVHYLQADVVDVKKDNRGNIEQLVLNNNEKKIISGDFFVDCSGFNAVLLGKALSVPLLSKTEILLCDYALAIQLPHSQSPQRFPSYTLATAEKNGWIWDIGLQNRRGIGYVFSSAHQSIDSAEQTLAKYVGQDISRFSPRLIPMKVGHREVFWQNNCVALGLAQGFVEPLEATGLLLFDVTAKLLAESLPLNKQAFAAEAQQYNSALQHVWQSVVDFVKLHYCLSDRTDSDFWQDNRLVNTIPDILQQRLALWQHRAPLPYDFDNRFELFTADNYRYVLYGMNYPTDKTSCEYRCPTHNKIEHNLQHLRQQQQQLQRQLPSHAALIEKIKRYGLQTV